MLLSPLTFALLWAHSGLKCEIQDPQHRPNDRCGQSGKAAEGTLVVITNATEHRHARCYQAKCLFHFLTYFS